MYVLDLFKQTTGYHANEACLSVNYMLLECFVCCVVQECVACRGIQREGSV